jgi:hypothetical protein
LRKSVTISSRSTPLGLAADQFRLRGQVEQSGDVVGQFAGQRLGAGDGHDLGIGFAQRFGVLFQVGDGFGR